MKTKIDGFEVNYRPNTSDEEVIKEGFKNDVFIKRVFEYEIKNNHTIIDIGAHIGVFTMTTAKKSPNGKIFSFEPCHDTFELLKKNVEDNKLNNVSVEKVAISDTNGKTFLYYDEAQGNWGHSITAKLSESGEEVQTLTLSEVFKKYNIAHCDLIKFNCEGAEFKILLNLDQNILKKIDTMIILFHEDLSQHTVLDIKNHLKSANFTINIRENVLDSNRGWLIAYRPNLLNLTLHKFKNFSINFRHKIIKERVKLKNLILNRN